MTRRLPPRAVIPLAQVLVPPDDPAGLTWRDQALSAQTDRSLLSREGRPHPRTQARLPGLRGPAECLEYALEHDERFGIWGGLSERERRRLKRERPVSASSAQPRKAVA